MTPKQNVTLSNFRSEREALQKRITADLQNDPRVVAAWLFGSLGRNDADELSDMDIWVVVADEYIQEIIDHRQQYVARIQTPAFYVEAPQNAPLNGGYLMAYYDMLTGPHQVDWYWQPQSLAYIPTETVVLFDRLGLPYHEQPIEFPARNPVEEITETPLHFISYFWAMLLITSKYVVRKPESEAMKLLPYVLQPFHKAQHLLGQGKTIINMPLTTRHEKLAILYHLANEMCELMPMFARQGKAVPDGAPQAVYKYLALVEEAIR